MIPRGSDGIRHLSRRLRDDLAGAGDDAYLNAELRLIANMLEMVASDFDKAFWIVRSDIADISAILREALAAIPDLENRNAIVQALSCDPDAQVISEMREYADLLMVLLVAVHARVDRVVPASLETGDLNAMIWRFLDAYVQRNSY